MSNFDLSQAINLLERTPKAYKALFYGLGDAWTTINEGPETWSAFDIVGHLIHGEMTDWIPRCKIILSDENTDKTFQPFDRFAQDKLSKGKTIETLLDQFETLRNENLAQLKSWNLTEKDLNKTGIHPELGTVTLKQHLATWTTHDFGHLYQISRVFVKYYGPEMGPWQQYSRILKDQIV